MITMTTRSMKRAIPAEVAEADAAAAEADAVLSRRLSWRDAMQESCAVLTTEERSTTEHSLTPPMTEASH